MSNDLRNFLALSYEELEQLNLMAKEQRKNRVARKRLALGHGLGRFLLGARRCIWIRQGPYLRPRDRQGRLSLRRRHSRSPEGLRRQSPREEGLHAQRCERN